MRMRRGHRTIAVAAITIACCMCTQVASANILRVDSTSAAMTPDGSSWALSFPFLQEALTAAQPGDVIWVAQGVYFPDHGAGPMQDPRSLSFVMKNQVQILGGFAGLQGQNPDDRDVIVFETILSGDLANDDSPSMIELSTRSDNSFSVVNGGATTTGSAQLDGFTISGGTGGTVIQNEGTGGAGVVVQPGTTPTFRNCTIRLNWVDSPGKGGGMFLPGFSVGLKIEDCTFIDNEGGEGGGLMMRRNNTDIVLDRCRFEKNIASGKGGGGLLIKAISTAKLTDCVFLQNQVKNAPEVNASSFGGGGLLICSNSSATLRGCTFDGNVTTDLNGGAMFTDISSLLTVIDSAFINNESRPGTRNVSGSGGAVYLQTNNSTILNPGYLISRVQCRYLVGAGVGRF